MKKGLVLTVAAVTAVTVLTACSGSNTAETSTQEQNNVGAEQTTQEQQKAEDYLLDTDVRTISSEEIQGKTELELKFLKAEILARHGCVFEDDETLSTYFNKKEWYTPDPSFSLDMLTDTEMYNYNLIEEGLKQYGTTEAPTEAPTSAPVTEAQTTPPTQAPAPVVAPAVQATTAYQFYPRVGKYVPDVTVLYCRASDYASLREYPDPAGGVTVRVPCRGACLFLADVDGYLMVNYNGYIGYVRTDLLSVDPNEPLYYGN